MTVLSLRDVVKPYQGLRPLRIRELSMAEGERITIVGLDAAAAEVFVGLVTGALLPESGAISLFERSTADVADSDAWLAMLDGVGIVTDRAVLIDQFSAQQNIAMPFTLYVDPVPSEVHEQVTALAREAGLDEVLWAAPVGRSGSEAQLRVRLARALALNPRLLLLEHPSATLPRDAVARMATDVKRIADRRRMALLTITADVEFAAALGGSVLTHEPATGALKPPSVWRKLFR
jgi:putative ABC transport system ATP-binding protein